MNLIEQITEIFEVIDPQCTKTLLYIDNNQVGFKHLMEVYLKEEKFNEKETLSLEDIINFQKFVEKEDLSFVPIPLQESLRRILDRTVAAYTGKAVFFSDHHHLYQPDRYDTKFADYIHEKICKECYNSMSSVYQYYSVNFGPTLLEWFRKKRPDLMDKLRQANSREPFMGQTYTHQILPLIRNEEDLRAEIIAGIGYRDFIFGPLPKGAFRGIWIPECTIGRREARLLAKEGVDFVILRGDQSAYFINTGKPYKLVWKEKDGTTLELKVFYYHSFSKEFSFDKWTTDNPYNTMNHVLNNVPFEHMVLLAHDGELVHHRWEHCHVDVSGFFKELPIENYLRKHPYVIMTTPNRYLRFLKMKSLLEDREMSLEETELPDFPTSWSCGGYGPATFSSLKGVDIEDIIRGSDREILNFYAELLVIRQLQGANVDPVKENQWQYLVNDQFEKLAKHEKIPLTYERKLEIRSDMYRGVNICYDIRRFNKAKVGGAGRWAFGSLDSGNSDYQTYLREAVMLVEDKLIKLFKKKVNPYFSDMAVAKADFVIFRLDEYDIPEEVEEKFIYLQKIYPSITYEEARAYPSRKEFLEKHMTGETSKETKMEVMELLVIWNRLRKAYTSCAYFFDDLNNHVAEDAVLRATEAVYLMEEGFKVRLSHDFFEKLKKCKSRYRAQRNQGPDITASRIARLHFNILKIGKAISSIEHITEDKFVQYIKEGKYSLPHPPAESHEYFRAFVDDLLIGFTSREGIEQLITRTSREVSQTKKSLQVKAEKVDVETGEVISRFKFDVSYDQLEPEKPYVISSIDNNILISNLIEEKYHEMLASFYINNIFEYLPEYDVHTDKITSVYIDPEKITLDYGNDPSKSRRDGIHSPLWEISFYGNQNILDLNGFTINLRITRKDLSTIREEIKGMDKVDPHYLEKFYNNIDNIYNYDGIGEMFNDDGEETIIDLVLQQNMNIEEALKIYKEQNPDSSPERVETAVKDLIIYNLFLKHDEAIGRYELDERHKKGRDITLFDAVDEYCDENNIPYKDEFLSHKLWKYQRDKVKYYQELLDQEKQAKAFLEANIQLKNLKEKTYTIITEPVVYVHGAANEEHFEGFYPDNEVITDISLRYPNRNTRVIFIPGGPEFAGQIQYFRKMQRYLYEKFNISNMRAGIFPCGTQKEFLSLTEKESTSIEQGEIFFLPSIENKELLEKFSKHKVSKASSINLKFDRIKELEKFCNYIKDVDIIYLGGGSAIVSGLRYNSLVLPDGRSFKSMLEEFVLRGGILMGVSAGAMVMGTYNITYIPKSKILQGTLEGLGIFPATVQVHYEEYGIPYHLEQIKKSYPDVPIVAVDTKTAVMERMKLKLTLSGPAYTENCWHMSGLVNKEILEESCTAVGLKTVTSVVDREEVLFDGMECFLK